MSARRGWRQSIEPGLYRAHRLACPSSIDRRPGRRCQCPYEAKVPGVALGTTRSVTLAGPLSAARAQRRRLMAVGRPATVDDSAVVTLDDLAKRVFQARSGSWAANTLRNREDDYVRRLSPVLGDLAVEEIDRRRVEGWLSSLIASGASRRMIVQAAATLRVILGVGVEWSLIEGNPARRLRLPRPDPSQRAAAERVIGREDLEALVAAAGDERTASLLRVVGETGLRRGEVSGLQWDDVDLPGRRLEIRRQVVQERLPDGGHRKVVTGPKAGRARRVAISSGLSGALGEWFRVSVTEGGADALGYVWPGRDGGPMRDRSLARALERACARAGLIDDEGRPLVSPHRLRHSSASVMIREGVPLTVVAAQLGHADPAITARIYAHLVEDRDLDLAAAAFERE